jgi:hypothetical protein
VLCSTFILNDNAWNANGFGKSILCQKEPEIILGQIFPYRLSAETKKGLFLSPEYE